MSNSLRIPIGPNLNLSRRKKELKGQLKKSAKIIIPIGTLIIITHLTLNLSTFKSLFFTLAQNVCGRNFEQYTLTIS